MVHVSDSWDTLTKLHTVISIKKGSALQDKAFNTMKLDGECIVVAEISLSEASQGLLELQSSSAKAVNSLAFLQEMKSQNMQNLGT